MDPASNQLTRRDETRHIEPKVMDLLVLLAGRSGRTVSKGEIFDRVWPDVAVTDAVLYRAIFELRQILEENPGEPTLIVTTPKRGYQITAPAEPIGEPLVRRRFLDRSRTTIAVSLLAVAVLGWFGGRRIDGNALAFVSEWLSTDGGGFAADRDTPRRVLVADFRNQTGDRTLDELGMLAVDWVSRGLARTGLIEVIPSVSVFRSSRADGQSAEGRGSDLAHLIEESGVDFVVSGEYMLLHEQIVFEARITDAETNQVLGVIESVRADPEAVFEGLESLKERVTGSLANVIDPRISSWSTFASQPPTFRAYRQFVEGLDLYVQGRRAEARAQFLEAGSDQSFPTAHIWAMNAASDDNLFRDSLCRALLPIRDSLPEWDQAMLDYHRADSNGNRLDAYRAMSRVVQLAPASEWRHLYAGEAIRSNRPGEALKILSALEPPPRPPPRGPYSRWNTYPALVAISLHLLGKHDDELAHIQRWSRREPGWGAIHEMVALAGLGRGEEVMSRLEDHLAGRGWSVNLDIQLYRLGLELKAHGDPERAGRVLQRAIDLYENAPDLAGRTAKARRGYGRLLHAAGNWEAARLVFERLVREDRDVAARGDLGLLAGRLGDLEEARRISEWYADWSALNPLNGGWPTQWRARIAAAAGLREEAVSLLRQAFEEGWSVTTWEHLNPEYEEMRGYAPFDALMKPRG